MRIEGILGYLWCKLRNYFLSKKYMFLWFIFKKDSLIYDLFTSIPSAMNALILTIYIIVLVNVFSSTFYMLTKFNSREHSSLLNAITSEAAVNFWLVIDAGNFRGCHGRGGYSKKSQHHKWSHKNGTVCQCISNHTDSFQPKIS